MSFLPPRPLRVQRGYVLKSYFWAAILGLVGLSVASAYLVWQWNSAQRILQDQEIWASGVPALDGSVTGRSRTRQFIFKEYELDVSYTDPAGRPHAEHFTFDTILGSLDSGVPPVLRVDPNDPSRYAISWAVECSRSRWASFWFMSIVGALIGCAVAFLGWALLDRARLASQLAVESVEVECPLVSVTEQYVNGRPAGNMIYRFVVPPLPPEPSAGPGYRDAAEVSAPPAARLAEREVVMPKKHGGPFYTSRGREQRILALVSRKHPKRLQVVRHDFHPYVLGDDEQAAAIARVRTVA
ncbi:MAG: DUF3592 domain-containing protein [Deltaproteobacteria bacterium]